MSFENPKFENPLLEQSPTPNPEEKPEEVKIEEESKETHEKPGVENSPQEKYPKEESPKLQQKKDGQSESREKRLREAVGPDIEKAVHHLVKKFSQVTGIEVEDKYLPKVFFDADPVIFGKHIKSSEPSSATWGSITINESDFMNKDLSQTKKMLSEEVAHFFRQRVEPVENKNVAEFFGFLGTRILYPELKRKTLDDDEKYNERIETLKQKLSDPNLNKDNRMLMVRELQSLKDHYYGYKYASRLDLDKIHDWKKLFSMETKEAKKRFFTPNPDYSGL